MVKLVSVNEHDYLVVDEGYQATEDCLATEDYLSNVLDCLATADAVTKQVE